jgi:uncharacterized membrane protein YphA (DoxX/SURF4 family)
MVQILLAAAFLMAGIMKTTTPMPELAPKLPWTTALPEAMVRFLGALGLILPSLFRVRPVLTPIAAAALALVMILAVGFHVLRGEPQGVAMTFTFGLLAAFVAWGRYRRVPIAPRG